MTSSPPSTATITDEQIDEAVDAVLAAYPADNPPVERAWLRQEVRKAERQIRTSVHLEHQSYQSMAGEQKLFTDQLRVFRGRQSALPILVTLVCGTGVLLGVQALFHWTWPFHYVNFTYFGLTHKAGAVVVLALAGLLMVVTATFIGYWQWSGRLVLRNTNDMVERAHARLTEAVRVQTMDAARAAISGQVDHEESKGAHLYETDSSGLVETAASEVVAPLSLSELERFIREHTTSAIGIAGPRGCGKSTTIRYLTGLRGYLGVYIQAPVYYEPADFVRVVHAEIASQVLRRAGVHDVSQRSPSVRAMVMQRLAIGLACAIAGGAMMLSNQEAAPAWFPKGVIGLTGLALFIIGLTVFLTNYSRMIFYSLTYGRRFRRAAKGVNLAEKELETLHWKTSVQTKDKNSFKIFQAFTMDTEDQVGLDQRDRSHPERVTDLRDFLLRLRNADEVPPVLIAIDELDKIASPDKAIEAINGLKDLFHITETHFVVSVSEDALDSFALRGVPVRDVFDSSFDTVMRVRPLTAADSWELLRRRASLFNEWAALLCHVVAGGLPRDLVRSARHCVDLCNRNDGPLPVTDLAAQLVKEETAEVVEAAIRRVRSEGTTSLWLLDIRQQIETADKLSSLTLDALFADRPDPQLMTALEANVAVFLLIMVTVAELFEVPRGAAEWRAFATGSGDDLERLAAARTALSMSHFDALNRLIAVRASTQLADLPSLLLNHLRNVHQS